MKTIKTAISIQKPLFDQADDLARKLKISRSHLFVLAVDEFITRHQNQVLLDDINKAYESDPDPHEKAYLSRMRKSHRKIVEGEW